MVRFTIAALLMSLAACQTSTVRDLTRNGDLYTATGYEASHRQQRKVWIAPLQDQRKALPTHAEGIYPLAYTEDSFWARPIRSMLDDVLRSEISESGIFAEVVDSREAADWVIEPAVFAFHGAVEERIVGRVVRGQTVLHVRVLGERDARGQRGVVREQDYMAPVDASGMLLLPDPHAIAGASLRKAVGLVLIDLDHGGRMIDGRPAEAGYEAGKVVPWRGKRDQPPIK